MTILSHTEEVNRKLRAVALSFTNDESTTESTVWSYRVKERNDFKPSNFFLNRQRNRFRFRTVNPCIVRYSRSTTWPVCRIIFIARVYHDKQVYRSKLDERMNLRNVCMFPLKISIFLEISVIEKSSGVIEKERRNCWKFHEIKIGCMYDPRHDISFFSFIQHVAYLLWNVVLFSLYTFSNTQQWLITRKRRIKYFSIQIYVTNEKIENFTEASYLNIQIFDTKETTKKNVCFNL